MARSVSLTATNRSLLSIFVRRLRLLQSLFNLPNTWIIQTIKNLLSRLLSNPHVAELLRFLFLGTVVEVSKVIGQKVLDSARHFFIVKASFKRDDFAFDWVKLYLEDLKVWDQSRVFRVSACNPLLQGNTSGHGLGEEKPNDGRPKPVYQPAPSEPELFRWRDYWITVNMDLDSEKDHESVQILTLSVWSRNRKILDDFVQAARTHFLNSSVPPRILRLPETSGSVITARFMQGDISYDWMRAFMRAQTGYEDISNLKASTKTSDLSVGASLDPEDRPLVVFKPAPDAKQRVRWRDQWVQFDVDMSFYNQETELYGQCITVTVHNSKRSVLQELVAAAREEYLKSTTSKVIVHLSNSSGSWTGSVTKNRRALNTLILPEGVKEALLDDAREFLDSEEWYMWAGVPHRRGYLLYGEPGTGKSTTIHALAGELGLRIYYIQLASKGMDDSTLVELIASTPSRCIILLEDIDCAFLSREDDDDDDDDESPKAREGLSPGRVLPKALEDQPRSEVTLSGLLNVLDSVASEEGRITFATTNHIEKLDPALIRPGRIDVKIKYELATHDQISQTFLRFFERRGGVRMPVAPVRPSTQDPTHSDTVAGSGPNGDVEAPELVEADIHTLCEKFADLIPEGVFSLAQVQGYLLTKKFDPRGAVINAPAWLDEQFREKRKIEELKEKRRRKAERKAIAEAEGSGKPTKSTA